MSKDAYTDDDLKEAVRYILEEGRSKTLKVLNEFGDEFGPVDLGNFSDFKNIFMEPFKDVVKTTMGSAAKVSSAARTSLTKFLRSIPTLVVPFLSARYDDIYEKESERLADIQRKYGDVFARTDNVFKGDAELVAFMLNPALMLSAYAAVKSPMAALDIADALSGESPEVTERTAKIRKLFGMSSESVLHLVEDDDKNKRKAVIGLFNDKSFQRILSQSHNASSIRQETRRIINDTLNAFLNDAKKITAAKTLEDIEKIIGKNIERPSTDNLKPDETERMLTLALNQFKNACFDGLAKGLEMSVKEFNELQIPEGSDLEKVYSKVINDIKGMKN